MGPTGSGWLGSLLRAISPLAHYARWITSSCVGRNANTSGSEGIPIKHGHGCSGSKPSNRTCLRLGSRSHRLGDRSRMNREVHVRFWEGVGVRFTCATQLNLGLPTPISTAASDDLARVGFFF